MRAHVSRSFTRPPAAHFGVPVSHEAALLTVPRSPDQERQHAVAGRLPASVRGGRAGVRMWRALSSGVHALPDQAAGMLALLDCGQVPNQGVCTHCLIRRTARWRCWTLARCRRCPQRGSALWRASSSRSTTAGPRASSPP